MKLIGLKRRASSLLLAMALAEDGLVEALYRKKGLDPSQVTTVDLEEHKQREYDKLAQAMRQSLDMDQIYRILEEGAGEEEGF